MIKLFTMVKDEIDIAEDWIQYHGTIFGFHNLYIVDNMSTDGTYELIQKYVEKGVNMSRHHDYTKKGDIMKELITHNKSIIAFPLDIDEFIVYYDKNSNKISTNNIIPYLDELIQSNNNSNMLINMQTNGLYKCDYINSKITNNNKEGYKRAALEATNGKYDDKRVKIMTKSFFDTRFWNGNIDHGNHCNFQNNYTMSNICLIHYHRRNLEQHKKKVINNLKGFGYNYNNLEYLKSLDKSCAGAHHVRYMIRIHEGKYNINLNEKKFNSDIDLTPVSNYIKALELSSPKELSSPINSSSIYQKRFEYIKRRNLLN